MNAKSVEEIANAVLYEGYLLYPYRASSVKNRQRWNFGVVYPKQYSDAQKGIDLCATQTECLLTENGEAKISVKVRFLQAIDRAIGEPIALLSSLPDDPEAYFHPVPSLRVAGGQCYQAWQEATEREVLVAPVLVRILLREPLRQVFELPATKEYEEVRGADGQIAGLITRTQERITGQLELAASRVGDGIYKVTLRVLNQTPIMDPESCSREQALSRSLLSAHSILWAEEGEFVSLLETPDDLRQFASCCCNTGTWPVLAGDQGQRGIMFSSPIILYDYPRIAPESAGDLFDGTEIDEILALRILTLTEDEKREMREGDQRARQILERTEALPAEQFAKLHGTLRGLRSTPEDRQ